MTLEHFRRVLQEAIAAAGSQTAWSRRHGVSLSYINAVVTGRVEPGDKILSALGYRKVVSYEPTGVSE